jgi:hypothetical protein
MLLDTCIGKKKREALAKDQPPRGRSKVEERTAPLEESFVTPPIFVPFRGDVFRAFTKFE